MGEGNCCFVFKLDKGCLILGGITFLCSTLMTLTACTYIVLEDQRVKPLPVLHSANITNTTLQHHILDLNLSKSVIDITLGIILVMGVVWLFASVVLVFGIRKNKASCVMFYFLIGIFITILFLLSGLLELLHKMWAVSLATFLISIIYLHCLTTVYSAYDRLWRGGALSDREQLILDEDFDIEDVD